MPNKSLKNTSFTAALIIFSALSVPLFVSPARGESFSLQPEPTGSQQPGDQWYCNGHPATVYELQKGCGAVPPAPDQSPAPTNPNPAAPQPSVQVQQPAGTNPAQANTGQENANPNPTLVPTANQPVATPPEQGFERFKVGVGVDLSLFGPGVQGAVSVTRHSNIRAGFNYFTYGLNISNKGADYNGTLQFESVKALYDWFPFAGSFHLSGGILGLPTDPLTATVLVNGGQTVTFNHVTYVSNPADPLKGSGNISTYNVAPMFLLGFGNLVPRRQSKHWSGSFEIGAAYQGSPKSALSFVGSDCNSDGSDCRPAMTDAGFQANVQADVAKYNKDASPFRFYPIISGGIGYRF